MTAPLRTAVWRSWSASSDRWQLLLRAAELDAEAVHTVSQRRLAGLLRHAAASSPGWQHRLLQAGIVSHCGVDLARFHHLPILERSDLTRPRPDLHAVDAAVHPYVNTTGGSTGEPVQILQDRRYLAWARITKAFFDRCTGVSPGEPKIVLWGAQRDRDWHARWSRSLRHWVRNERWLDAYRVDRKSMEEWTTELEQHRPAQVLGYAESLDAWARFLLETGRQVRPPRTVMSTAGVLTPDMRATIGEAFRAPIFDRYGSREVGDIACETTDHDGLIVPPLHVYVEIVDDQGHPLPPGREGDVVVTSLTNWAMPIIRYRIGDRAAWRQPEDTSGAAPSTDLGVRSSRGVSGWPRLSRVLGRVSDHLIASDGSRIHPGAVRTALYHLPGIDAYQLVQERPDELELRVVASGGADQLRLRRDLTATLEPLLRRLLGASVHCTVSVVDRIETSATGKHRYVICRVADGAPVAPHGDV